MLKVFCLSWSPPPTRVSWSLCPLQAPPRTGAHDSVVESAISQQKAQAHCLQQRGVAGWAGQEGNRDGGEKNPGGGEEGGDWSKKRAKAGNVGKSGQVSVCNCWPLTTKAVILAQLETEEQRGKKSSQKEVRGREWMLLASQGGVAGSPTYFLDVFV